MLRAYLDRGEKASATDLVMCTACTIFKESAYKQFERPWNRMLNRWDATAFHATDFYPGGGEFKRDTPKRREWFKEDCKNIPNLIGKKLTRVMCVAFRPDEFVAKASPDWKERFGTDTYAMAVQLCLVMNGWWLQEKRPAEYFAYVREKEGVRDGTIDDAIDRLRKHHEYGSLLHIKSYKTVAKGEERGTEASDFVAWHWNKHAVERLGKGLEPRKDFLQFAKHTDLKGKVQAAFITGQKLDTFFRTLERGVREKLEADGHPS
jgi:hypothetical protein